MRKNMLVGDLQSVSEATLLKTLTIEFTIPKSGKTKPKRKQTLNFSVDD